VVPIGQRRVGGHYRVDGPTESLESDFLASADLGLAPGSFVLVLVDRKQERVLLPCLADCRCPGPAKSDPLPGSGRRAVFLAASGYLPDDFLRSAPATSAYRLAPPCGAGRQPTLAASCYASYPAVVADRHVALNGRGGQGERLTFALPDGGSVHGDVGFRSKAVVGLAVWVKVWHDRVTDITGGSWTERTDDNPQRHTDNIGPAVIAVVMMALICFFYFTLFPYTATWPREPLAALAAELLPAQPLPPRMVDDSTLFIAALQAAWPIAYGVAGLAMIFGVLGFAVPTDSGWQPGPYLMIATMVVGPPAVLLGWPALRMSRDRRTICLGVLGVAVVATRGTSRLGTAQGTYRVEVRGRPPFLGRFSIEPPAALDVAIGRRLEVLVDPEQPKVLLNVRVRPANEAAA